MLLILAANMLAPPGDRDADDRRPAAAQPGRPRDPDEDEDEERGRPDSPIVVTGRRLDAARTRIDEALGASIYALDNEAIENRPGGETGSIAAILAQAPGAALAQGALTIRGSRAIQVRINDVIVPEAVPDAADHLSSRLAETTRLIAGALPAQFGFAPGGVISVTTKSGLYQSGGQIELFGDTSGMIEPAAEWAGALGALNLFGSGSFARGSGLLADASGRRAPDISHEVEGLAFADHLLGASDRVSLILGGSRERHRIGQTGLGKGTELGSDAYAIATFQHSVEAFTIQASLFGASARAEGNFAAPAREHRIAAGTQIDASLALAAAHVLRAGLLVSRSSGRHSAGSATTGRDRRTAVDAYLQDEWKLTPALTFNPGLRADWLRGLGSRPRLEPRASFVWALRGTLTAHLGYARYSAAPPPREGGQNAALPDEVDDYLDAGIQRRFGPLMLGVDAYWRGVRNLLIEHERPGSATPSAVAFRRARLHGVELSSTYARGPITAWANLALSKARATNLIGGTATFPAVTLAATRGRWLPLASDRPLTVSAGATWRLGRLSVGADLLAGSGTVETDSADRPNRARAPAYAALALAAVYHLRIADRPVDVRADLTNLTDVRYPTSDANNLEGGWTRFAQGRALLLGVEAGF
jgi:outer membrane cobalamin receptor